MLQCVEVSCSGAKYPKKYILSVYQAVCCSMPQCVAACCSVLQLGGVSLNTFIEGAAVYNSVSQCVAVCCSVLQCAALVQSIQKIMF